MALARFLGSFDLKIPDPTNTPSAPNCIISAASAGVAMPPAAKLPPGRRRVPNALQKLERDLKFFGFMIQFIVAKAPDPADVPVDAPQVANGLDDVAGPGFPLRPDHGGEPADPAAELGK